MNLKQEAPTMQNILFQSESKNEVAVGSKPADPSIVFVQPSRHIYLLSNIVGDGAR